MLTSIKNFLTEARKAVVALVGISLTVLTLAQAFDHSSWVGSAIGALTVLSIYLTPNGTAGSTPANGGAV